MTTEFLRSLTPIDHDHPATSVVEHYLTHVKRVPNVNEREIGVLLDEDALNYFYKIDGGILEIRAEPKPDGGYSRTVVDYITRPREVQAMLGNWTPGGRAAPPEVLFHAPD